jgi:hypothetical protein
MVSREGLRRDGLRAYEIGRLRSASRVVVLLAPLTTICLIERRGRVACVCTSLALVALAVWLRWRNRGGVHAVSLGLQAGSLPLLLGFALDSSGLECGLAGHSRLCTALAVLVGGTAGGWISSRKRQSMRSPWNWGTGAVAMLSASLGCLRLGVVGLSGVYLGLASAIGLLTIFARARGPRHIAAPRP